VQIVAGRLAGSGVRIDAGILTNAHVVPDAETATISTSDGRQASAAVVKYDPVLDLALLQVTLDLPPLGRAPSRAQRQGDEVFVLGYPRPDLLGGGEVSVSGGHISAFRDESSTGRALVQTDAAINHGNSGGALITRSGVLIGVPSFILQDATGLNFAVGTETIEDFLRQPLISLRDVVQVGARKNVVRSYATDRSVTCAVTLEGSTSADIDVRLSRDGFRTQNDLGRMRGPFSFGLEPGTTSVSWNNGYSLLNGKTAHMVCR
jgi:S1-C subfamily serine protease